MFVLCPTLQLFDIFYLDSLCTLIKQNILIIVQALLFVGLGLVIILQVYLLCVEMLVVFRV